MGEYLTICAIGIGAGAVLWGLWLLLVEEPLVRLIQRLRGR